MSKISLKNLVYALVVKKCVSGKAPIKAQLLLKILFCSTIFLIFVRSCFFRILSEAVFKVMLLQMYIMTIRRPAQSENLLLYHRLRIRVKNDATLQFR